MLQHYMNYYESCEKPEEVKAYQPNNNEFCTEVSFDAVSDPCLPTLNKRLTGTANPRTLIQPTIAPPSHDINIWRQNPSYEHSQINKKTSLNPSWAGFITPENASGKNAGTPLTYNANVDFDTQIHSPYLNPIEPDVYTSTDQFQAINNNLGIAFTPQFPNTTVGEMVGGNELFFNTNTPTPSTRRWSIQEKPFELLSDEPTARAPKIRSLPEPEQYYTEAGPDYIYDPRFAGYGASDRSYTDKLLGNPKFYYDDINAVRMPNYITRSKIDSCVTSFGDAYGKLNEGHLALNDVRPCAEKAWIENSLDSRTSLMKSLMRKRNEEIVQIRQAPKHTIYPA